MFLGDGEVVEQVIGQQTAEDSQEESPLDDLIRQLQNQQDEHRNSGNPAGENKPRLTRQNVLQHFQRSAEIVMVKLLHTEGRKLQTVCTCVNLFCLLRLASVGIKVTYVKAVSLEVVTFKAFDQ